MGSLAVSSRRVQSAAPAAAWALTILLLLLLPLISFVQGRAVLHSPSPAADQRPRAALVSLAHEHDLQALLFTMRQLESTFNHRYHYDWVIFSTKPLSDGFKSLASNASSSHCIFEVISGGNWIRSRQRTHDTWHSDGDSSASVLLDIRRWKSGHFARENRLRDYDWFWRIEPGAQFSHDIDFDVFRFMRDQGIAYGFDKALFDREDMRVLVQEVKAFMEKHPELLHVDADVSWLLTSDSDVDGLEENLPTRSRTLDETELDSESDKHFSTYEAFASWMSTIYKTGWDGIPPTFDIGSLAFLRSQSHQVLVNHLDTTVELRYQGSQDILVPTISASMFLPQKSIWNLRRKDVVRSRLSLPKHTPGPKPTSRGGPAAYLKGVEIAEPTATRSIRREPGDLVLSDARQELFRLWDLMFQDLERQRRSPNLRSGNTATGDDDLAFAFEWLKWKLAGKLPITLAEDEFTHWYTIQDLLRPLKGLTWL
ncbi:Glycolipid 2-alpha-mannosyltransferase 1 [Escovopsis weberi]|uniref:Glycolipid 2-alpha-mannosyltransferase 1 n=1 Tax=Escovopsis weberi TaxID=150374 RepID=A0A0M9VWK4_ESCWE|nr:Glycolipid 2-alpha-mannosyltransferase 1 [Escovopsis weberi]